MHHCQNTYEPNCNVAHLIRWDFQMFVNYGVLSITVLLEAPSVLPGSFSDKKKDKKGNCPETGEVEEVEKTLLTQKLRSLTGREKSETRAELKEWGDRG